MSRPRSVSTNRLAPTSLLSYPATLLGLERGFGNPQVGSGAAVASLELNGEEPHRAARDRGYGVSSALPSGRSADVFGSTLQRLEHGLGAYIDSSQWPPAT